MNYMNIFIHEDEYFRITR